MTTDPRDDISDIVQRLATCNLGMGISEWSNVSNKLLDMAAENATLREKLKEAIRLLAEQDFAYNRKTNTLIERHAALVDGLRAQGGAKK